MTSAIASGEPLNGMCSIFTPAMLIAYSATRWLELPMPADANGTSPGFAFAASMTWRTLRYGPLACATMTYGVLPRMATSTMSFSES